jgi:integrase
MHVKPAIGDRRLGELRRADVFELLDVLQTKKGLRAQVNRVRSQIVAALNWAIERDWLESNPAATVRKRKIETPRDRVLSPDELRLIWEAADALGDPSRAFVKTLILTGQRRDEIRCMKPAEINLTDRVWVLPAERNKGKRNHPLPLSEPVVTLLAPLCDGGAYVFSVRGDKSYAGTKRLKDILDIQVTAELAAASPRRGVLSVSAREGRIAIRADGHPVFAAGDTGCMLAVRHGDRWGFVRLTEIISPTEARGAVKRPFAATTPSSAWQLGLPRWTFHDFRRTLRTGLSQLHVPDEVAERVSNRARKGMDKVYNHHAYIDEMRTALNAWANHVAFIVGDAGARNNVVKLHLQAGFDGLKKIFGG